MTVKKETPITVSAISEATGIDWRTVNRVINFLLATQDEFAAHSVRVLKGKGGTIVWMKDRLDKIKLQKDVREWYIKKRFFDNEGNKLSLKEMQALFVSEDRTSVEEVVSRLFKILEIEDDITVAEIARRIVVNRKTVDRALDLILEFQDRIAEGIIMKKEMVLWRKRPSLYDLDETTLRYFLTKWYFPNEAKEIPEEQEIALLQIV